MGIQEESLALHEKLRGKLSINSKMPLRTREDLSLLYTPGVAEASRRIARTKSDVYKYTGKGNMVAIVTDGSAVLGLGNIGPEAALPVMEGKAVLFKEFADIDAVPICLASQDVEENIRTIRNLAPAFGGINLEDIKAPECFAIEAGLQDLGIPVMHDDQHGTAVVVLAALTNALKVVGKKLEEVRVVVNGAGSAGMAVTKLLVRAGLDASRAVMVDSKGALFVGRPDLDVQPYKLEIARMTNSVQKQGKLADVIVGSDVFIGVSVKGVVNSEMIKSMAHQSIIFAMANPDPEIMPDEARAAGAAVVATGRSDFPNQVNNVLGFPGIFRGALDCGATRITEDMKLAAARALAALVPTPTPDEILPSPLDPRIVPAVAEAVKAAWRG